MKIARTFVLILGVASAARAAVEPAPSQSSMASPKTEALKHPTWMLENFRALAYKNPEHLLQLGDRLFAKDRLLQASVDPRLAFEWQHRLAMVSAVSEFFVPSYKRNSLQKIALQNHSRKLIETALLQDNSLLVRDGAVESLRRIFRMKAREARSWKKPLETAFLSDKNILDGEGFFIRETILTTLREAGLKPSPRIKMAALKDKNDQVKGLLKLWRTQAYDN